MITSTDMPSSPFHLSNLTTDATVYPPPAGATDEPESKKRKLADGALNGKTLHETDSGARYTNQMLSNKHVVKVHDILKKECEELADSIVSWQPSMLIGIMRIGLYSLCK